MIAVTGANGLLGSLITNTIRGSGGEVIGIVRRQTESAQRVASLDDPESLMQAFQGIDTVIHTAGMVSFNPRRKKELFETNVNGTGRVVNAALRAGVENLIHISSVAAFSRSPGRELINESAQASDHKFRFPSYYGFTKHLAEREAYRGREEGLRVAILNPSVILAPSASLRSSARIFEYVVKEKIFYTDATLNFVDGRDVAKAVMTMLEIFPDGEQFILNGGSIPYVDFFRAAASGLNKRAPFVRVGYPVIRLAAAAEELRTFLIGQEPIITRSMADSLQKKVQYDATKSRHHLNLQYVSLEDTLSWCCGFYQEECNGNY